RRLSMLETVRSVAAAEGPPAGGSAAAAHAAIADDMLGRYEGPALQDSWSPFDLARLSDDLPLIDRLVAALLAAGRPDDAAALVVRQRRGFAVLGRHDQLIGMLMRIDGAGPSLPWSRRVRLLIGYCAYVVGDAEHVGLLDVVEDMGDDDPTY